MIYFVHFTRTPNVGDLVASPMQHMMCHLKAEERDLTADPTDYLDQIVILGGGGMIGPKFAPHIKKIIDAKPRKLIGWSIGRNASLDGWDIDQSILQPNYLGKFDLLGLRDSTWVQQSFLPETYWVPCPSCMSPEFDKPIEKTEKVGVYLHWENQNIPYIHGANWCVNNVPFDEAVDFIRRHDVIVTNCRHGAYWASLLQTKCVLMPQSTRHYTLRYEPMYATDGNVYWSHLMGARVYPDALETCREANRKFYKRVMEVIG